MEFLDQIWGQISQYIDVVYLLTFVLLSYFVKHYFKFFLQRIFRKEFKFVFVVLIIATITAIPFILTGSDWQKILFSYALGTSLHEVILTWIEKKINNIMPL